VELEKLTFEEAAAKMQVSRNTVWRLAEKAREKLVRAIIEAEKSTYNNDKTSQLF
jgi:predicted DNA-binding protein (UPF0251 family)